MTEREALKQIAGFTLSQFMGPHDMALACVDIARKALAQPEQEPVAWIRFDSSGRCRGLLSSDSEDLTESRKTIWQPLYTTPPQRTWVGLTDEQKLSLEIQGGKADVMLAELVEQWLKEKNT